MKKKLFKFFEIGKLEKGLFRIFIVLCVIYYPFYGYLLIKDKYLSRDFQTYKMIKKDEKNNFDVLCEYHSRKTFKVIDGALSAVMENVYGFKREYTGINLLDKTFKSKKKCIGYNLVKRNQIFSELSFFWTVYILSPLILMFTFLFLKKLVLWLYRGFK